MWEQPHLTPEPLANVPNAFTHYGHNHVIGTHIPCPKGMPTRTFIVLRAIKVTPEIRAVVAATSHTL